MAPVPDPMTEPSPDPVLAAILAELRAIRMLMERQAAPAGDVNVGHARILHALEPELAELGGLPFDCHEAFHHGRMNYELGEALATAGVVTATDLSLVFRSLRGRWFDDLRVVRDGRYWRLERRRPA